jgi:hypothetical protein
MASFPKIARIRSFPASFLRTGSPSDMNRRYVALRLSRAAASASTPRCASITSARLVVRRFLLATRSTSIARCAGIVTLWRTDGAVRVRAFGLFLTPSSYHPHHCGAGRQTVSRSSGRPGTGQVGIAPGISIRQHFPHGVRGTAARSVPASRPAPGHATPDPLGRITPVAHMRQPD